MKTKKVTGFFLLLTLLGGCIVDDDLHRTIFIRDKQYHDLPEYSEWGYNTFGAFMNDDVFVSGNNDWYPATVSANDTAMTLSFLGEKRSKEKDTTEMILSFVIPRFSPRDDRYLLDLNDKVLDMKNISVQVHFMRDTTIYPVAIQSGEMHFKRVQNLLVDNNPEETILSGTFEFQGIMDGVPVSVTLGRFDVGVVYYYNYSR
jgi:hypothetical protein